MSTTTNRRAARTTDYAPLAAPPNPRSADASAAIRAYMHPTLANPPAAVVEAKPEPPRPLYPLDVAIPIWNVEAHDDGCAIWIDDPASMTGDVLARGEVVTVTCFEKGERE